jgi:hypothetical protein
VKSTSFYNPAYDAPLATLLLKILQQADQEFHLGRFEASFLGCAIAPVLDAGFAEVRNDRQHRVVQTGSVRTSGAGGRLVDPGRSASAAVRQLRLINAMYASNQWKYGTTGKEESHVSLMEIHLRVMAIVQDFCHTTTRTSTDRKGDFSTSV